jgi:GNAT superfamily N-acetyltransferase
MSDFTLRLATLADVPELLNHRRAMFEDMGSGDAVSLAPMLSAFEKYLRDAIPGGTFRGWFSLAPDGSIAAGCAVAVVPWPPGVWNPQIGRPYILNLYVYPEYRRQGLARKLTQTCVDWCRIEGFTSVTLHASDFGRALYESLGFQQTNEMRLKLK